MVNNGHTVTVRRLNKYYFAISLEKTCGGTLQPVNCSGFVMEMTASYATGNCLDAADRHVMKPVVWLLCKIYGP